MFDSELREKGLKLREQLFGGQMGEEMNKMYLEMSPELEAVAVEWVMGGTLARPGLDLATRELICIASHVHERLPEGVQAHAQGALRAGATKREIFETVFQCIFYAGLGSVIIAMKALRETIGDFNFEEDE